MTDIALARPDLAPWRAPMLLLETVKRLAAVVVLGVIGLTTANLLASNPLVQDAGFCAPAVPGLARVC